MKKERKPLSYLQKYWITEISAYLASIGVPITTALVMFPPEILEETKMSVGLSVIVTTIVAISVLRKRIAEAVQNIGPVITYAIIVAVCLATRYLADQLLVVGIVGLCANAGSVPLFRIADKNRTLNTKLQEAKQDIEIKTKAGA